SDATPDYEQGFDARKFLSTQAGKAQVFCLATQNELLGIQSLAFDFDSLTVPLAVSATTGHTLKFRFDKLSQTPYYYTLLDTYTQSTTYLNESPVYEFTSRKDLDTNRFQLKISKIKPTETLNTEIKVSQTDEKIVIEPLENLATIELFDLNGRRLYVQELVPESENTINLRAYSGVLLLRISGSVQTVRKFWVNN
ncbi:MAG: hypothetical protein RIS47_846, partial [Bacteroidota bacterium]